MFFKGARAIQSIFSKYNYNLIQSLPTRDRASLVVESSVTL